MAGAIQPTCSRPRSGATLRARRPITIAISPSNASSSVPRGRATGSPSARQGRRRLEEVRRHVRRAAALLGPAPVVHVYADHLRRGGRRHSPIVYGLLADGSARRTRRQRRQPPATALPARGPQSRRPARRAAATRGSRRGGGGGLPGGGGASRPDRRRVPAAVLLLDRRGALRRDRPHRLRAPPPGLRGSAARASHAHPGRTPDPPRLARRPRARLPASAHRPAREGHAALPVDVRELLDARRLRACVPRPRRVRRAPRRADERGREGPRRRGRRLHPARRAALRVHREGAAGRRRPRRDAPAADRARQPGARRPRTA